MTEHERRELEPPAAPLKRGDKEVHKVKQAQEWLTLHDFATATDGDFGPATEAALKAFQEGMEDDGGTADGVVDLATWEALTRPLRDVVEWKPGPNFADAIVDCAHAHLAARAREVGGPNSGAFVRIYMDGQEGPHAPWCAGLATYVLRQALGHDKWRTFSCDELAAIAQRRGLFLRSGLRAASFGGSLTPGSLFLIRSGPVDAMAPDWTHCGIVTAVGAEHFETIEGNTNQGGSREGTAVCKRVRAFNGRTDFILMGEGQ